MTDVSDGVTVSTELEPAQLRKLVQTKIETGLSRDVPVILQQLVLAGLQLTI